MRQDELYSPQPPSVQLGMPGIGSQGEADVESAMLWIVAHPDAYAYILEFVRRMAEGGHASIKCAVEMMRVNKRVSIPNALAPALARIIEAENPELEGVFTKHASRSDGFVS